MKNLVFFLGFGVAGLVGAIGGRVLLPENDSAESGRTEIERLDARIDDLSMEIARVRRALRESRDAASLRSEPRLLPDAPEPETEESVPVDASSALVVPADAVIEEKVRKVIDERTRAAQAARAEKDEAAQRKKEVEWIARLKKEQGLTDFQARELQRMLIDRREVVAEFKRRHEDAPDEAGKEIIQAERKQYGEDLQIELKALLSPEQYDAIMHPSKRGKKDGNR